MYEYRRPVTMITKEIEQLGEIRGTSMIKIKNVTLTFPKLHSPVANAYLQLLYGGEAQEAPSPKILPAVI